ncbi:MAG: ParA family protein [Chloroflexota bacterium]|nr:ParA family protein [Chloroflexota bacterium]
MEAAAISNARGTPEDDLARIISVANQKGGVGKTTTSINLGGALAELGHKVLCVDMDPQANLTVGLGLNARDIEVSIANVLLDPSLTLEDIVESTATENVDVAPSDIDLSATENQLFSSIGREHALREVLHGWAEKHYDYILIDCPPTLGLLTINALVACDGVIIPVQTQYYSLKGFTALATVITQIRGKGLNPRLRILGLLPTFYDGRTNLAKDMLAELSELGDYHLFDTIVKQTVRLGEAPLAGKPVTSYASRSPAAAAYRGLAQEVIELG